MEEKKQYLCIWGDGYTEGPRAIVEEHGPEFFTEARGYCADDIANIGRLRIGSCCLLPGIVERHSVVRIA